MAHRRVLAAATAAALAIAGCGPARLATTPRQARSLALAIELTPLDLPAYSRVPHVSPRDARRANAQVIQCVGATPRRRALADVNTGDFQATNPTQRVVTAEVVVMPSRKLVANDMAALAGERMRTCASRQESVGGFGRLRTIARLPATSPGVVGWRITAPLTVRRRSTTLFADAFAFQQGQVEVELATLSLGSPFTRDEERRLLGILMERAKDHAK